MDVQAVCHVQQTIAGFELREREMPASNGSFDQKQEKRPYAVG
jgi:hypothetical protein